MSLPRRVLAGKTYLLTRRCLGRRFLLRADPELNHLFAYCLALSAERHGVEVQALCVMSNHYHLVVTDVRGVLRNEGLVFARDWRDVPVVPEDDSLVFRDF